MNRKRKEGEGYLEYKSNLQYEELKAKVYLRNGLLIWDSRYGTRSNKRLAAEIAYILKMAAAAEPKNALS